MSWHLRQRAVRRYNKRRRRLFDAIAGLERAAAAPMGPGSVERLGERWRDADEVLVRLDQLESGAFA